MFFRNTIRVSNSYGPGQARHFVEYDLSLNCLQRLSADDKVRNIEGNYTVFSFRMLSS